MNDLYSLMQKVAINHMTTEQFVAFQKELDEILLGYLQDFVADKEEFIDVNQDLLDNCRHELLDYHFHDCDNYMTKELVLTHAIDDYLDYIKPEKDLECI
jgi:hypothetical protein